MRPWWLLMSTLVACDGGGFQLARGQHTDRPVARDTGETAETGVGDQDGDGFGAASDCNDDDPAVHPGAIESCNGGDDDCDGEIDEGAGATWYRDADGDGYGNASITKVACAAPTGFVANAGDCDDADSAIHPGAVEVCDGLDQDCDGLADDGALPSWYADADGDGYGSNVHAVSACKSPFGYVAVNGDCNDFDALVNPGSFERCNGGDDDCDGAIDEGLTSGKTWARDADGDGFGDPTDTKDSCAAPTGYVDRGLDCDDTNAAIHWGATEVCNGVDDDCDGLADEGLKTTWFYDADGDGYGTPAATTTACSAPSDYSAYATDCDDTAATVHPLATEVCANSTDDDCDGKADEGC